MTFRYNVEIYVQPIVDVRVKLITTNTLGIFVLCFGETISIVYDMEGQNFEVDGGSSVALCQ